MNLQQMIVKEVEGSAAERDVLLKVEGDRCEMDATSLKLFSVLVYIHLLFDVFSRSGAKESVPAGIAVGGVVMAAACMSPGRRFLIEYLLLN